MAVTLLISLSDFAGVRDLSSNIKEAELNTYIRMAQDSDLKPLLGEALYYDFTVNVANAVYQKLLNGDQYLDGSGNTVNYEGVKPMLIHYAYARYVQFANIKTTKSGFMNKENEYSEQISSKKEASMIAQAREMAKVYEDGVFKYLVEKATDNYPLWDGVVGEKASGSVRITAI